MSIAAPNEALAHLPYLNCPFCKATGRVGCLSCESNKAGAVGPGLASVRTESDTPAPAEGPESGIAAALRTVPASDLNFQSALDEAPAETIRGVLEIIQGQPGQKTRERALQRALKKQDHSEIRAAQMEAAPAVVTADDRRDTQRVDHLVARAADDPVFTEALSSATTEEIEDATERVRRSNADTARIELLEAQIRMLGKIPRSEQDREEASRIVALQDEHAFNTAADSAERGVLEHALRKMLPTASAYETRIRHVIRVAGRRRYIQASDQDEAYFFWVLTHTNLDDPAFHTASTQASAATRQRARAHAQDPVRNALLDPAPTDPSAETATAQIETAPLAAGSNAPDARPVGTSPLSVSEMDAVAESVEGLELTPGIPSPLIKQGDTEFYRDEHRTVLRKQGSPRWAVCRRLGLGSFKFLAHGDDPVRLWAQAEPPATDSPTTDTSRVQ